MSKTNGSGWVVVTIVRARNFTSTLGVDPFAVVHVDGVKVGTTATQTRNANPVWKERYVVPIKTKDGTLDIEVFDAELNRVHVSLGVLNINPFKDGDSASKWFPLMENDTDAEVFVTYRRSFGAYGNLLTPPPAYSLKDPAVPPLDLFGECKRNIGRLSTHLYYVCVPYWWLSERWMWTNPVESAIVFVGTTYGLYNGYFLAMVCLAMGLYLSKNYVERASVQHEAVRVSGATVYHYPDPFAIFRAFDDLQKQMLFVSIYTNWIGDVYEYYAQILCWERPAEARKLFTILVAWTVFGLFDMWPSVGTMLAAVNVYLFTLYPLYFHYPHLYTALTTLSFLKRERHNNARSTLGALERNEQEVTVSQIDASDVPVNSTAMVVNDWNFISAVSHIDQHLQSGGTVCAFGCKVLSELTEEERGIVQCFINVTSFHDETTENFVPRVNTAKEEDQKQYTAILTKTMYIIPNVTAEIFNPLLISSFEYQDACQPGNKVISPDERSGYFRFTKTIIHLVLKLTLMFKVSHVTDEATLRDIQKCIDPELHHMSLDRVILFERTKRSMSKMDMTAKVKSILLYRTVPHGVLVTNMTCVLNTSLTSLMSKVVNNLASLGSKEVAETAQRTRQFFRDRASKS